MLDQTIPTLQHTPMNRAFTILELLIIIAIIALLMAITLPALNAASFATRTAQSASNLRQLGNATHAYLNIYANQLPQFTYDIKGTGNEEIIATLFCGKLGTLPAFGLNEVGADERPLNQYIGDGGFDKFDEVPICQSPLDIGGPLGPGFSTDSMYDTLGTSYTLNDHSLEGDEYATLIPRRAGDGSPGGRMPRITDTTKTWVIGEHPIYNYQENNDRGLRWYRDKNQVKATLWFMDGHTATVTVPPGVVNTTKDYTFLP